MGSMKKSWQILNTREVKEIREKLEEQYGYTGDFDYVCLRSNKDKIYIVTRAIEELSYEELPIDGLGMYFASVDSGGNLRLSIEGTQMIGPHATENVYELDEGLYKLWVAGHDIPDEGERTNFLIMKHGDDYVGSGKRMENKLKNYVPKSRTVTNLM